MPSGAYCLFSISQNSPVDEQKTEIQSHEPSTNPKTLVPCMSPHGAAPVVLGRRLRCPDERLPDGSGPTDAGHQPGDAVSTSGTAGGEVDASVTPTPPSNPAVAEIVSNVANGLQSLSLKLDYPKLEIAEDRAYIPLFFTILGDYQGTNDITVRARFVSGTATPGQDFDTNQPVKVVPSVGGLGSMNWLPLPTILDEINEGLETAVFELSIDGSTNAPARMEVSLLDDLNPGEVGFVSTRFQINEGSTNGYVQIRLWRTLNTRQAATVTYRLEGPGSALAVLGGQTNRTATFEPGQSQVFVQIPLVNNTEAQGSQDVTLTLEPIEGG